MVEFAGTSRNSQLLILHSWFTLDADMTIDSVTRLREWGIRLEQALNISLVDHNGALALKTKAGHLFGVGPVLGQAALIFTGIIGSADETMASRTLYALLAANMNPSLTGTGSIAVVPQTRDIVFRLVWMPAEHNWTEQMFGAVLAAFAEHVDALAATIANREIEQLLDASLSAEPTAAQASHFSGLA